jgi:hypothetical protein
MVMRSGVVIRSVKERHTDAGPSPDSVPLWYISILQRLYAVLRDHHSGGDGCRDYMAVFIAADPNRETPEMVWSYT